MKTTGIILKARCLHWKLPMALMMISCCNAAFTTADLSVLIQPEFPKVCGVHIGCLQGKYMPGFQTTRFEAFMGIPYALPPIDELRFANPKSFPRWWGILNATAPKMDCIQKNYLLPNPVVEGVEDCLYLNVYRPAVRPKQRIPVMVYIHGGGWFSGSAGPLIHGPEYFMDTQDVILVTIAYRLGPFGFLSTNDANMPGNLGLKDQNLALRWVKRNIAAFGGDPQMVTIFGQSAGAVSVHMHMLSRQSEGLFRSIIALSGTANVPFAITDEPLAQTRTMAKLCNVSNVDELSTVKLARALRTVDAATLVNAGDGLKYWHVDPMTNFRPIVEKPGTKDAFFTQHPTHLLNEGKYKAVPWMVGVVPQEGAVRVLSILADETLKNQFNANFDDLLEQLLEFPSELNQAQKAEKLQLVIDEYFEGQHEINNTTAKGFMDCITNRGFHQPFFNTIAAYVHTMDTKKFPIYPYIFNYEGAYSYASIFSGGQDVGDFGVVHCDDLIYTFRSPLLFPDFERNSTHALVAASHVENFVHFARFGKPKNVDALRPCNSNTFNSEPDTICDYQELVNTSPDSFKISTNNKFHVARADFWNKILELEQTRTNTNHRS